MADPFLAQITLFAGNFAPRGWAFCDGQLLPISQNQALFSLLGTNFGGDGRTTFGLPDLRSRVAVHPGTGPGLSQVRLGEKGGAETHALTSAQLPAHSHSLRCKDGPGNANVAKGNVLSADAGVSSATYFNGASDADMRSDSIGNAGGGQSFNIRQPFLGLYFIIAIQGIFPSRN